MQKTTPAFLLFLLFAFSLGVLSCGDDDDSSTDSEPTQDDDTAANDDDASPSDDDDSAADNPFLNPEEMGPYPVGNTSFIMEDTARELRCGEGNRRLVVEVWYPAADNADEWPENTLFDFFLNQREEAIQIYIKHGHFKDESSDIPTGSYRDAPLHPDAAPLPILIFSHGFTGERFQNFNLCTYLASHGYLVAAPDHTCNALAAPFPDGIISFTYIDSLFTIFQRVGDISFLIDEFTDNPPEMFAGRLATDKVGILGHSFGGWTVSETIKLEPRALGMAQLASFALPDVPETVTAPSIYFTGEQDKIMARFSVWHNTYIENMPTPKWELVFHDTGHFAFSDYCIYSLKLATFGNGCGNEKRLYGDGMFTNPTPERMHELYHPYVAAFFGWVFFGNDELHDYLMVNSEPSTIIHRVWE